MTLVSSLICCRSIVNKGNILLTLKVYFHTEEFIDPSNTTNSTLLSSSSSEAMEPTMVLFLFPSEWGGECGHNNTSLLLQLLLRFLALDVVEHQMDGWLTFSMSLAGFIPSFVSARLISCRSGRTHEMRKSSWYFYFCINVWVCMYVFGYVFWKIKGRKDMSASTQYH